jgi:hypothetical protein
MSVNVLQPIALEEYERFYQELYMERDGVIMSQFRVPLDSDPSMNPKGINTKLALVQALKDRLVVILNRAIRNESYWRALSKKVEGRHEAEVQRAMLTEKVKTSGNADSRKAMSANDAADTVLKDLFKGEGKLEEHVASINKKHSEAIAFLSEVKNLYENIDSSSMNLAVQLKSVMVNTKIYGDAFIDGGKNNG